MSPEEINKKAKEAFPNGMDDKRDTAMLRLGFETAYKEISSLPTIKGWVARDGSGTLYLYHAKPHREVTNRDWWMPEYGQSPMEIEKSLFPDLRWDDEPIEVELPIIRK